MSAYGPYDFIVEDAGGPAITPQAIEADTEYKERIMITGLAAGGFEDRPAGVRPG